MSSLEQPPTLYVSLLWSWRCHCTLPLPPPCRMADAVLCPPTQQQMLVPRQGYLHSMVPQALRLLQHLLPPGEDTPWFEHGALPLRWGVPAGVLYDLVATQQAELPWRLTIHFRGYPDR